MAVDTYFIKFLGDSMLIMDCAPSGYSMPAVSWLMNVYSLGLSFCRGDVNIYVMFMMWDVFLRLMMDRKFYSF
jgi:hypothetical protein